MLGDIPEGAPGNLFPPARVAPEGFLFWGAKPAAGGVSPYETAPWGRGPCHAREEAAAKLSLVHATVN